MAETETVPTFKMRFSKIGIHGIKPQHILPCLFLFRQKNIRQLPNQLLHLFIGNLIPAFFHMVIAVRTKLNSPRTSRRIAGRIKRPHNGKLHVCRNTLVFRKTAFQITAVLCYLCNNTHAC